MILKNLIKKFERTMEIIFIISIVLFVFLIPLLLIFQGNYFFRNLLIINSSIYLTTIVLLYNN